MRRLLAVLQRAAQFSRRKCQGYIIQKITGPPLAALRYRTKIIVKCSTCFFIVLPVSRTVCTNIIQRNFCGYCFYLTGDKGLHGLWHSFMATAIAFAITVPKKSTWHLMIPMKKNPFGSTTKCETTPFLDLTSEPCLKF